MIADQWMPEMTGRELLLRAHALHPDAQRALLVGWGDKRSSSTVLQGCALGELDNYILKPWTPPEVHLYPVIGEFLAKRAHRVILAVRGQTMSATMSTYLHEQIARLSNVELRFETEVIDADGTRGLEHVTLRDRRTGTLDRLRR